MSLEHTHTHTFSSQQFLFSCCRNVAFPACCSPPTETLGASPPAFFSPPTTAIPPLSSPARRTCKDQCGNELPLRAKRTKTTPTHARTHEYMRERKSFSHSQKRRGALQELDGAASSPSGAKEQRARNSFGAQLSPSGFILLKGNNLMLRVSFFIFFWRSCFFFPFTLRTQKSRSPVFYASQPRLLFFMFF